MLVIPRQPASFKIEAVADGRTAGFAAGATVSLQVEAPASNDTIQVPPVDVGGVPRRMALTVDVDESGYAFSAPPPEITLEELADEARAATREVLGGVDRVADAVAVQLTVAVDGSASMRRLVASGAVANAARVLEGVSLVLGGSARKPASFALVGQDVPIWDFDPGDPDAAIRELASALERAAPLIGVDLASPRLRSGDGSTPQGLGAGRRRRDNLVYLVTDGVPGAIDRIAAEAQLPGELRHLVVLQPGAEPLGALPIPATKLQLAQVADPMAPLLSDHNSMLAVCRSLVAGHLAGQRARRGEEL
jgi:hypothetical protein